MMENRIEAVKEMLHEFNALIYESSHKTDVDLQIFQNLATMINKI